jgi:hypothetical protein
MTSSHGDFNSQPGSVQQGSSFSVTPLLKSCIELVTIAVCICFVSWSVKTVPDLCMYPAEVKFDIKRTKLVSCMNIGLSFMNANLTEIFMIDSIL